MTAVLARPSASAASRPTRAVGRALLAPGIGLAAALVSVIGAGTPSYWGDEAASVMSAQRPLPSLLRELANIDAVHGFYYALLHLWIDVAGATEFATRLPSVVAAGAAAAGLVVLGRRLFGLRVGVIAGLALTVIPQFLRMAIETRSYAIGIAAAVWLTVLLVRMLTSIPRSPALQRIGWAGYALGLAASVWMFEFLAFMVVVHLALVWALRVDRTTARCWLLASAAGALLASPLVVVAFFQRGQIAFLAERGYDTAFNVLVTQWFGTPPFAVAAWAAILVGAITALRAAGRRRATVAVILWVALPTAALLVVDVAAMPVYNLRYPAFSLGGVALAMALGIDAAAQALVARLPRALAPRLPRFAAIVAALAILATAAWPSYLAQRGPYAKGGGSDIRQSSALLASLAAPDDAVVFDREVRSSQRPAMAYRLYPTDFALLDNVALTTPYYRHDGIWDQYLPATELGARLSGHPVVWAWEIRGSAGADVAALRSLGYRTTRTYSVHRTVLYRMERTRP
ncbi:MAG: glycosyltransferase family 39 protein [Micrococcales bacterium]|nr:glycosyltransferase family 39 protein [Micrococcales bacterium]